MKEETRELIEGLKISLKELANEYTKHHRKCPAVEYVKDDVHCKGNFYVPPAPKEWEAKNWG